MKKNHIAVLILMASLALAATACNNPLLAANAEGASEFAAEVEAQVQAALAEAEAANELPFVATEEPVAEVVEEESEAEEVSEEPTEPEVEPVATVEPMPEIEICTDRAEFITDVTVPDGADFTPGQAFIKTWRLRNAGTCTWTSSYALVFDHGDAMGGPASQALPGLVHPGESVDLSLNLTAPGTEGGYKGYWLLRNSEGLLFGIGVNANVAFWVEIEVLEEDDDPLVFEIMPIPMFPVFVSSGSGQNLPSGTCFDLDAGAVVGCGSASADLRYDTAFDMEGFPPIPTLELEIRPRNGAGFALFGDTLPTGSDCQASGLTGNAFEIQSKVYCYRTDAGKYGRIEIASGDLMSLTFDWATYTFP